MTKQKIVDLCYQKMLDHYSNYGMSGFNKPFDEVRILIKEDTFFKKIINYFKNKCFHKTKSNFYTLRKNKFVSKMEEDNNKISDWLWI